MVNIHVLIFMRCLSSLLTRHSDPNGEKFELPYWPPYSYTEKTYMQLRPIPEIAGNLKPNKVAFWNTVFSSVHVLKEGTFKHLSDEL